MPLETVASEHIELHLIEIWLAVTAVTTVAVLGLGRNREVSAYRTLPN